LRHDAGDSFLKSDGDLMARLKQADPTVQCELFAAPAEPAYRPNLDKVRARLEKLLAEARAARATPWEPSQLSLYRLIFPQMTLWLPEDEARQYRLAFDAELERLASLA
jgi:hypothetical protein